MNCLTALLLLLLVSPTLSADWTLVSQNLNRLFDDIDDPGDDQVTDSKRYHERIRRLAERITGGFGQPDVLAVQEVEKKAVLEAVAQAVVERGGRRYRALLVDGNDRSGIDVGYLVADGLEVHRLEPLFADRRYRYRKQGKMIEAPLYARPPLLLEFCRDAACFTLVNVHLRSMRGLRHRSKGKRIALKRQLQAETLARWVQRFQETRPGQPLALVGDFNALQPPDRHVDVIGTIIGQPDQQRPRRISPDLVEPDLIDPSIGLPKGRRYSYRYKKRRQLLDYLLLSRPAAGLLTSIRYDRIDYRLSDHAALRAAFDQP
jgi:endonuclease/exonuclease/phosphatase family metal-dependent hydrolase